MKLEKTNIIYDVAKAEKALAWFQQSKYNFTFKSSLALILGSVFGSIFLYLVFHLPQPTCSDSDIFIVAGGLLSLMGCIWLFLLYLSLIEKKLTRSANYHKICLDHDIIGFEVDSIGYAVHVSAQYADKDGFIKSEYLGLFNIRVNNTVQSPTLDLEKELYILPYKDS